MAVYLQDVDKGKKKKEEEKKTSAPPKSISVPSVSIPSASPGTQPAQRQTTSGPPVAVSAIEATAWKQQQDYLDALYRNAGTQYIPNSHAAELNQNMMEQGLAPIYTSQSYAKPFNAAEAYAGKMRVLERERDRLEASFGEVDIENRASERRQRKRAEIELADLQFRAPSEPENDALFDRISELEKFLSDYDQHYYQEHEGKKKRIEYLNGQIRILSDNAKVAAMPQDVQDLLEKIAVADDDFNSGRMWGDRSNSTAFEAGRPSGYYSTMRLAQTQEEAENARQQLYAMGYSIDEVDTMYSAYKNIHNDRVAAELKASYEAAADAAPISSTIGSVIAGLGGNVSGAFGMLAAPGERNNPVFTGASLYANTTQETVRANIENSVREKIDDPDWANFFSKVAGYGYAGALAAAQSALAMGLGSAAGVPLLGEALLGVGAASQTYNDMLNKGYTYEDALVSGSIAALIETLTEHVSLENLRWLKASGGGLKNLPLNLVKSFVTEGSEEIASDLLNEAWDYFAHGGMSEYYQFVTRYLEEHRGATEAEARSAYAQQFGEQLLESGVIGGFSGMLGAGWTGTANSVRGGIFSNIEGRETGNVYQNVYQRMLQEQARGNTEANPADMYTDLLQTALTLPEGSKARQNLVNMQETFQTESPTKRQVRQQGKAINEALYELSQTEEGRAAANKYEYDLAVQNWAATGTSDEVVDKSILTRYGVTEETMKKAVDEKKGITAEKIVAIDNGVATVQTSDGRTVRANEAQFKSRDQAALYLAAPKLGYNANTTNDIIQQIDSTRDVPVLQQMLALEEAVRYGRAGTQLTNETMQDNTLTADQLAGAYTIGRGLTAIATQQRQNLLQQARERMVTQQKITVDGKTENIYTVGGLTVNSLKESQKVQAGALMHLAKAVTKNKIILYASELNEDGQRVVKTNIPAIGVAAGDLAPNAAYDRATGDIYVDINAGQSGQGLMLFHASHEFGHYIKQWNPAKFLAMQDFLVKEVYGDRLAADLIRDQMDKAKANGRTLTQEEAAEEMVADALQEMLTRGDVLQKITKLKQQDRSLWQKLKDFITNMAKRIRAIYKGVDPESREAKELRKAGDAIQKLADMFAEGLEEAGENFEAIGNARAVVEMKANDKFSMRGPVEERPDLIAVHNLESDRLLTQITEWGGFPAPSIAITRAKLGHTKFGDTTVLFDKTTIDPSQSRKNAVYSGDAYTPTTPQVQYKVSEKAADRLRDTYYDLARKYGDRARGLYALGNYAENDLNRKGLDRIKKDLKDDRGLREVFLREKGLSVPDVETREEPVYAPAATQEEAQRIASYFMFRDVNGKSLVDEFNGIEPGNVRRVRFASEHEAEIRAAMEKSDVPNVADLSKSEVTRFFLDAIRYDPNKTETVTDTSKRDAFLEQNAEKEGYSAWIAGLLDGLIAKKGIYNGKDMFYPSGNRRSWEQLHYEYNLENIVRAMYDTQEEQGAGFAGNNLFGASAQKYASVEEIREDEDRLRNIDDDEYEKLKSEYVSRLGELADSFARDPSDWRNRESASDLLLEAVMKRKTRDGIAAYLKKEGSGWTRYADHIVDDLIDLVSDVRKMPTGYFEAKPARAVYADEIRGVVLPNNSDEKLYDALSERGISYLTYERGNDADRIEKVNALADEKRVKFSSRDASYLKAVEDVQEIRETVANRKDAKLSARDGVEADAAATRRESTEVNGDAVVFSSRVTNREELDFLNGQDYVTVYRTMQVVDGKLHSPMAAKVDGKWTEPYEIGKWYRADERPDLAFLKPGKEGYYFKLNKGNGTSIDARYNPYEHTSNSVINDQFSSAYKRPNLVVVEMHVPKSELTSGYRAQYAKDTVGWLSWKSGATSTALGKKGLERKVLLSRWTQPVRILSDAEVAAKYKEMLEGTWISVADNTVTPGLLAELRKIGVPITESGRVNEGQAKFSVRNVVGASGKNYGIGVYLDSELLEGLTENEQKEILKEFVRTELAGQTLAGYDPQGQLVEISIAKKGEKYNPQNAKRRDVLSELYKKNNKNPKKRQAVSLADEIVHTAKYDKSEPGKKRHDWLDENGANLWDIWKVILQDKDNSVWEANLNIANSKDGRKILYDISQIKMVERPGQSGTTTTMKNNTTGLPRSQQGNNGNPHSDREASGTDARTLLSGALMDVAQTDDERKLLTKYQSEIAERNAEEAKLNETRREIRDMMFRKGPRDEAYRKKLADLKTEAQKSANRLEIYDKRLLKLEATKPLKSVLETETRNAAERARQQGRDAEAKRLNRRIARLEADIEHRKDMRQKGIDQRASNDLRTRIENLRKDFAENLSKDKTIPPALVTGVIDVCNLIDPVSLSDSTQDLYERKFDKNGKPYWTGVRDASKFTQEEIDKRIADGTMRYASKSELSQETGRAKKEKSMRAALLEMKQAYESLKTNQNISYDFKSEFEQELADRIGILADAVGNTPLRAMSRTQLEDVYDAMVEIRHTLANAKKQIGREDAITNYQAAMGFVETMQNVKDKKLNKGFGNNRALAAMRNYLTNPLRAVHEMAGFDEDSEFVKSFDAIKNGYFKGQEWAMLAQKVMEPFMTGENRKRFEDASQNAHDFGLKDLNGKDLKISKMQAMQILLTYERETNNENRAHLANTILIPDVDYIKKGQYAKALDNAQKLAALDAQTVKKLRDGLDTAFDRDFMEAARKVFQMAADAVNETSLLLKGRAIATEKFYIPYEVFGDVLNNDFENVAYNIAIANMGMTKSVQPNSNASLVMRGLDTVMNKHISDTAKYYGLAIPVRNFTKAYNTKLTAADAAEYNVFSAKNAIRDAWGADAMKLIEQAVADVQGSRPGDRSKILDAIRSAWVTATLAGNVSVWMKQAASYPTAGSVLSGKALIAGLKYLGTDTRKRSRQALWAEIDEHTPLHYMRRAGLSTQELGDFSQSKGFLKRLSDRAGRFSPMNWIQSMDVRTTAALWVACKAQAKSDNYQPGTDAYWEHVTELYQKVLEETQPMYDPMHRAEITKNKAQHFIVFQTQPLQNSGILRTATMEWRAAVKTYGKGSEQAKAAGKRFLKATTSQLASHMVFAAMTEIAAGILHKMNPWRDDDKELTLESVLGEYMKEVGTAYFGAVLPVFGNYTVSVLERIFGGSRYDVLSEPVVDRINTTVANLQRLQDPSVENVLAAITDILSYTGFPAGNIYNIANGIRLHAEDIINGHAFSFEAGVSRTTAQERNRLYDALVSGDQAKVTEIKATFKTEEEYLRAVRQTLTEHDDRIQAAVEARQDMDMQTYTSVLNEIIGEGVFSRDDVLQAAESANSAYNSAVKAAYTAQQAGDEKAFRQKVADIVAKGYDEEAFRQAVKDYVPKETDGEDEDKEVQWLSASDTKAFLYKALLENDASTVAILKQAFDTEKKYHNAIVSALKENDPRIREAAEARLRGDSSEYLRITKQILAEKHFTQDDVVKAVNGVMSSIKSGAEEDENATVTPWWEDESESGTSFGFKKADLQNAFASGDRQDIELVISEITADAVAKGKTQEDAQSSAESTVASALKDLYLNDGIDAAGVKTYLKRYSGDDDNDVYWILDNWDYAKENGKDASYGKYYKFYEAVQTGKNLKSEVQRYLAHGVKKETLASQITSYFKPIYKDMNNTQRAALKGYLLNAYAALGYNRYKKSKDIDKWLKS